MKQEAKIITVIFLFYLIFGLNNLGINNRFIAPHLLDSIIIIVLSLWWGIKLRNEKAALILFGSTLFLGFTTFLIDAQVLVLLEDVIDLQATSNFLQEHQESIDTLLILSMIIFYGVLIVWSYITSRKLEGTHKLIALILSIGTLILVSFTILYSIHLIVLNGLLFIILGLFLAPNSGLNFLKRAEYPFLLIHFLVSLLAIFEFVSRAGLIAFK